MAAASPALSLDPTPAQPQASARPGAPAAWQFALVALALFALGDPFVIVNRILGGEDPAPMIRFVWLTLYVVFLPILAIHWRGMLGSLAKAPILTALALMALLSMSWSILPDVTGRRAVAVVFWLAFAAAVVSMFGWREIIRALAYAFLGLAIASVVVAVGWPDIGIMKIEHPGAWAGVWTHKNQLGGHMAIAFLTFAVAIAVDPARRRPWLFGAVLAFTLVLLSKSATALVSCGLALSMIGLVTLLRRGLVTSVIVLTATAVVLIVFSGVAMLAPELLFGAIGREATFTGRTDIWRYLGPAIDERPWLGFGYGAFWEDATGPAWWVRAGVGWKAPNSHNGWMELTLGLGLVGAALFATTFLATTVRTLGSLSRVGVGVFAPGFLLLYLLQTLGEGYVLEDNNLLWTVFLIVALKLARDAGEAPA